jgi:hypothetical protein
VVSKPQVRLKGKAQADEKAQSAKALWPDEQYILKRFATQLLGLRWGFETTSRSGLVRKTNYVLSRPCAKIPSSNF